MTALAVCTCMYVTGKINWVALRHGMAWGRLQLPEASGGCTLKSWREKETFSLNEKLVVSSKLLTNCQKQPNETQQRNLLFLRLSCYSNNKKQSAVMETEKWCNAHFSRSLVKGKIVKLSLQLLNICGILHGCRRRVRIGCGSRAADNISAAIRHHVAIIQILIRFKSNSGW